ncbi:hypothetical protein FRC06_003568 [Ceratobasidium sp. 370]|nr:hypothetical protein FRC06_003568 [Ceratobasidium sp. 370]
MNSLAALTRTDAHPSLADDEEDETVYLALELGQVDPSLIPHCTSMRLVGLETATPFLQLGGSVFRGSHVSTLGTELVFHDASPDRATRSIRPYAQVEHKVLFNPVILTPKSVPAPEPGPSSRDTETPDPPASGRGGARGVARRAGRPSGRPRGRPRGTETRADL